MAELDDNDRDDKASADKKLVIVDFGTKKRGQVQQLRDGRGKLLEEVELLIDELKSDNRISESAQPVIIIVKERSKKTRSSIFPPLLPWR